ncbi:DUF1360 domain-containing protein [Phaeacidiphilus oryzae]|uniref:DUF1360 domain-containing protein n=1 Tax=Phaeacidiphilus oryzae TaxID=348818 RepID=UPI000A066C45|nr:DUF1360 domain-containing protein [Phaeacidiphilus oryzae]
MNRPQPPRPGSGPDEPASQSADESASASASESAPGSGSGRAGGLREAVRETEEAYAGDSDHPVTAYAGTMGVYLGLVGAMAGAARLTGRRLPDPTPWDLLLVTGATHRLSRLVAKDPVTSPLRAPFTRFRGTSGPAELKEDVRGRGARKAVGELLSCPFCTGLWASTGFVAGLVFAPRATRLAATALSAAAASDLLHFGRSGLQQAAGE